VEIGRSSVIGVKVGKEMGVVKDVFATGECVMVMRGWWRFEGDGIGLLDVEDGKLCEMSWIRDLHFWGDELEI